MVDACHGKTYHALRAKEDNKRPRTRPRSLSGAGPPLPPKSGAHRRGGRHRTAIATAVALGLETEEAPAAPAAPPPGSMERVRSHTRHRAAIAEARALWEDFGEDVREVDVQFPNGRRGQSVPDRSFAGRPKRPQRSIERSSDKGWFA
eukprot:Skav201190  [mRNA]  locus=scaffold633:135597:136040:- [translate_table: standard]